MAASSLEIHRVTPERWDDLVELFGPGGAYGGCWCMWNRETSREFEECKGEEHTPEKKRVGHLSPPFLDLLGLESSI